MAQAYNNHLPMQLNVYRQPSGTSTSNANASAVSKISGKLKKRQVMTNNTTALQTSCNTNPARDINKDRDHSVDATSTYGNQVRVAAQRDRSEGHHKGDAYHLN
jgi:hypothetical protein